MANQGMDVNQYLIDQYQEDRNAEIAQILAEPLATNPLLSSSSDDDFHYVGYTNTYSPIYNSYQLKIFYTGSPLYDLGRSATVSSGRVVTGPFAYNQGVPTITFSHSDVPASLDSVGYMIDGNYNPTDYVNVTVSDDTISSDVVYFISYRVHLFLSDCAEIFSWILEHIGELITFIFGNAFLSVSLLLFMCGAVISFYVRIRRS